MAVLTCEKPKSFNGARRNAANAQKLNGYEATQRLRDKPFGKDIMIVALTGWGQASDVTRSIEAGCSAHLVKPVDFAELERLLASAKK